MREKEEKSLKERVNDLEEKLKEEKEGRDTDLQRWDISKTSYEDELEELSRTLNIVVDQLEEKDNVIVTLQSLKSKREEISHCLSSMQNSFEERSQKNKNEADFIEFEDIKIAPSEENL